MIVGAALCPALLLYTSARGALVHHRSSPPYARRHLTGGLPTSCGLCP